MMAMDHAWIETRIPHRGAMNLLEQVLDWNPDAIRCQATSHRALDNPLRAHGRLGAACGVEYAAQAMALHGALLNPLGAPPRLGYLTSVRALESFVSRLDNIDAPLIIEAQRQHADRNLVLYRFTLWADDRRLLCGRASVMLDAQLAS